jgi:hypothetical protein
MLGRLPHWLLRAEGLAVAAASMVVYFQLGYGWLLLVVLALAPDLSMLGYVAGTATGATAYNAAHTYAAPVVLGAVGVVVDGDTAVQLSLIWLTHIGVDRLLGYGLKYPSAFKDTHLQRI